MLKGRLMELCKNHPGCLLTGTKFGGEVNIRFYDILPISELSIT